MSTIASTAQTADSIDYWVRRHLLLPPWNRRRSFDPETLVTLETAFDEAWITLKSSTNIRPNELARRICHLAMEGERDPVRLHDRALGELIPATTWRD